MLLSGTSAGYQSPFRLLMSGHRIPQERIAPRRVERFTRCGQIIPDPTYVMLKSKKNLIAAAADERQSSEGSPFFVTREVR
jgi:hypothetical protein